MAGASLAFVSITALVLLAYCQEHGPLRYAFGNWLPPVGIEYRVDLLTCLFLIFSSLIGFAGLLFGRDFVEKEIAPTRQAMFLAVYMLLFTGLCGIIITGDLFNIFVFLEISSLATYSLIALGPNPKALVSSLRYLIIGTIGTSFFLIGIGLFYSLTGTLNLVDLGDRLADLEVGRVYQTAVACIVIGTAIKAAVVPFHAWLPPCYRYAPIVVTVFLAGVATKASLYILYRVAETVTGWDVFYQLSITQALLAVSCIGVVYCPWQALRQTDVRMILAWSSLGQIAYMSLALGLGTEEGRQAMLIQTFNHAFIKSTLFLSLATLALPRGLTHLHALRGVAQRHILTGVVFSGAILGLAGIPLTSGFISKWYLYLATAETGNWFVLLVLVIGSLLGLLYSGRVLAVIWASPGDEPIQREKYQPVEYLRMGGLIAALTLIIFFGIAPSFLTDLTAQIAGL